MSSKLMTVVCLRPEAFKAVHDAALELRAGKEINSDVFGRVVRGRTVETAVVEAGKGWKSATAIGSVSFAAAKRKSSRRPM
jgi:hypothetical protein